LGAIEVRLSLNGGEAGAQFFSANAAVRDAIESALPKLREMLAQAGINLGDSHVRDEAFARRESGDTPQFGGNGKRGESELSSVTHSVASRSGMGLVDLYA
jgi:flagellar hook-length control protein FliK